MDAVKSTGSLASTPTPRSAWCASCDSSCSAWGSSCTGRRLASTPRLVSDDDDFDLQAAQDDEKHPPRSMAGRMTPPEEASTIRFFKRQGSVPKMTCPHCYSHNWKNSGFNLFLLLPRSHARWCLEGAKELGGRLPLKKWGRSPFLALFSDSGAKFPLDDSCCNGHIVCPSMSSDLFPRGPVLSWLLVLPSKLKNPL